MSDDNQMSTGEYEEHYGVNYPEAEEIDQTSIWTSKDGKRVRICDMHDNHLLNTIRVLREISPIGTTFRTSPERRRQWVNAMANEAYSRGLSLDPVTETEPVHE